MEILAEHLKTARKNAGFTQEYVADKLNISRSAVARWETGEIKPNINNLVQLANVYCVSTDWLLGIDKQPPSLNITSDELNILKRLITKFEHTEN